MRFGRLFGKKVDGVHNARLTKAINAPDVREKLEAQDLIIIADTPDEFATLQKQGIEQFGEIIKAAGIQPQ